MAVLLLAWVPLPTGATDDASQGVAILFDFGGGRWAWADVPVPTTPNAWCATVDAADALDLDLGYSFSQYGVFLPSVGDVDTPEDFSTYWGLWEWDEDVGSWSSSSDGALDLAVETGSAVAWKFAAFGDPSPSPNPVTREPWLDFRGGRAVQGDAGPSGPLAGGTFWAVDLRNGAIDSTLAVAGGKVFGITGGVFDWNTFEFTSLPTVFALDATSGERAWEHSFEGAGGFEIGSPAYSAGVVYATTSARTVLALDADDGTLLWETEVDEVGLSSSPTVAGGIVLTGTGGGTVVALDLGTGDVAWTANVSGGVYLTQTSVHDGVFYIGTENGTLHALSLDNGTELWGTFLGDRVRGTVLVNDDRIYSISGMYNGFINTDGRLHALDLAGNELWNVTIGPTGSSPAMFGDLVVVGSQGGLRAFTTTGSPAWSFADAGAISASPAVAGDLVYVVSNENNSDANLHTSAIALDQDGSVVWTRVLEPHNWALGSPAIADDRLYVASDNGWVYCLGDTTLEASFAFSVDGGWVTLNDTTEGTAASISQWRWEVPDIEDVLERDAMIMLAASGDYIITLTVTDEFGRLSNVSRTVHIELPDLVTEFVMAIQGSVVAFRANDTAPDLEIASWNWTVEGLGPVGTGMNLTFEFDAPGDYNVTLTIVDEYGRRMSRSLTLTIEEEDDDSPAPGFLAVTVALLGAAGALTVSRRRKG